MKKLRMDLDDLRVESFATEHDLASTDGTIWGHQEDGLREKPTYKVNGCNGTATQFSCVYSCHGADCSIESCVVSCPGGVTCGIMCDRSRRICPPASLIDGCHLPD
jgi:hypothetical protein